MSVQLDDDLEKGTHPSDQKRGTEFVASESPDTIPKASEKTIQASDSQGPPPPGPPPDGGFQAWMTVLGAFCGLFVSFGWINCKYQCISSGCGQTTALLTFP